MDKLVNMFWWKSSRNKQRYMALKAQSEQNGDLGLKRFNSIHTVMSFYIPLIFYLINLTVYILSCHLKF